MNIVLYVNKIYDSLQKKFFFVLFIACHISIYLNDVFYKCMCHLFCQYFSIL